MAMFLGQAVDSVTDFVQEKESADAAAAVAAVGSIGASGPATEE